MVAETLVIWIGRLERVVLGGDVNAARRGADYTKCDCARGLQVVDERRVRADQVGIGL